MKNNIFLEQSLRDKSSVVQITPHKAAGRSMGMITVILLAISVLVTACSKPENKELAGTWRWTSTTGGIAGVHLTPETEGFEAEFVFKGNQFSFYKDGKRVTSGMYRIDYDEDAYYIGNKPFYSRFRFHISGAQVKKISEATNGTISFHMTPTGLIGFIGYNSEAEGQVFSLCDDLSDGFCNTFVKEK